MGTEDRVVADQGVDQFIRGVDVRPFGKCVAYLDLGADSLGEGFYRVDASLVRAGDDAFDLLFGEGLGDDLRLLPALLGQWPSGVFARPLGPVAGGGVSEKEDGPGLRQMFVVGVLDEKPIVLVVENLFGLLAVNPSDLVDLIVFLEAGAGRQGSHRKPADLFDPVGDSMPRCFERRHDATDITSFFQDFPDRGLLGCFAPIGFPFGQSPIVVRGAMSNKDLEVSFAGAAKDQTAGGSNDTSHDRKVRATTTLRSVATAARECCYRQESGERSARQSYSGRWSLLRIRRTLDGECQHRRFAPRQIHADLSDSRNDDASGPYSRDVSDSLRRPTLDREKRNGRIRTRSELSEQPVQP